MVFNMPTLPTLPTLPTSVEYINLEPLLVVDSYMEEYERQKDMMVKVMGIPRDLIVIDDDCLLEKVSMDEFERIIDKSF